MLREAAFKIRHMKTKMKWIPCCWILYRKNVLIH